MAFSTHRWTRDDLDRLPDDGNRYEVLDGVLFVTPAPSPLHQQFAAWLNNVLVPFVATHKIGTVHHPRSVMVRDDSQLEPDLMVLPPVSFDKWVKAPTPVLVVEVLSSSTRRRDRNEKRRFYIEKGVEEYCIVDRFTRSVTRVRHDGEETATTLLTWSPTNVPATLDLDIAAMFTEVLG